MLWQPIPDSLPPCRGEFLLLKTLPVEIFHPEQEIIFKIFRKEK
jgi:hypothetical protein